MKSRQTRIQVIDEDEHVTIEKSTTNKVMIGLKQHLKPTW